MKRHIGFKKLVLVFLVVLLIALAGGYMRTIQWDETEWTVPNVVILQTFPEFDLYVGVLEKIPDNVDIQMGKTLIPLFTIPIPRSIFPNKDDYKTAGVLSKELFGYEFIRVGVRISLLGELYMNFHIAGIIIGMCIFGGMAAVVSKYFYPDKPNPLKVTAYSLTIMGLASLIAGDIVTVMLWYVQIMLPLILMNSFALLTNTVFPRNVKANS